MSKAETNQTIDWELELRQGSIELRDCIVRKARELDDGREPADNLILAAEAACKAQRDLMLVAVMGLLMDKSPGMDPSRAGKSASNIIEQAKQAWKPQIMLSVLEARKAKAK